MREPSTHASQSVHAALLGHLRPHVAVCTYIQVRKFKRSSGFIAPSSVASRRPSGLPRSAPPHGTLLRGEPSCGRRLRHSRGCWPPQGHPRPVEAPVMRRWPGRAPHTLHLGRCAGPSGLGSRPFLPPRHAAPAEAAKSRPGSEAVPGGWRGQRGARPPVSAAQRPCGRVDGLRGGASRSHGGA